MVAKGVEVMITMKKIIEACRMLDEKNVPKEGRYIRMSEANYKQLVHEAYGETNVTLDGNILGCRVFVVPEESLYNIFDKSKLEGK